MGKWTKWTRWSWGLVAALPLAVQAQSPSPSIDLKALDRDMTGARAQVLVLGSSPAVKDIKNMNDFIAAAKRAPGQMSFGTSDRKSTRLNSSH